MCFPVSIASFKIKKNETVSTLELKLLSLVDKDMFPLCLLEQMLDKECDCIKGVQKK